MQQWNKEPRRKTVATSRSEDIQEGRQADSRVGGRELSSRVFQRVAESDWTL
jgi:hypothetical protein